MSFAYVLSMLGWALSSFSVAMIAPALVSFGFDETGLALTFMGSAALTAFVGGALVIATRGARSAAATSEGYVLAGVFWIVLAFFGALPILISGSAPSITDAYFESISGLTTTGATVFPSAEMLPHGILFWRSLLSWIGGFATVLLALNVLSFGSLGGMNLFTSAIPRGDRDALDVRLVHSMQALSLVYAGLTLLCAVFLWLAGMSPFDAVNHAMSTLSTGGFSTREASIAAFRSGPIEVILIVFMVLAAVNMTLHWVVLHGRWPQHHRDSESQALIAVAIVGLALVAGALFYLGEDGPVSAVRAGAFAVISSLTTTGFTVETAGQIASWPGLVPIVLIGLILIGGSTGSTAGGVKIMRLLIFLKLAGRELARLSHPHGVVRLRHGGATLDEPTFRAVWGFLIIFLTAFASLAVALSLFGFDLRSALVTAAVTISNAGAALPAVGGGEYAQFSSGAKWVLGLSMVIGRLEVVTVLVFLSPSFWRR
jgi:trk system potassium uptake protein TrkH